MSEGSRPPEFGFEEETMGVEFDDWDEIQEEIKREQQVEDEDDDD